VELESLKQSPPNGPSANGDQTDGSNNEELTRLREEKEELTAMTTDLEKKLTEIKEKNNVSLYSAGICFIIKCSH